jgi:hypothetical protein
MSEAAGAYDRVEGAGISAHENVNIILEAFARPSGKGQPFQHVMQKRGLT